MPFLLRTFVSVLAVWAVLAPSQFHAFGQSPARGHAPVRQTAWQNELELDPLSDDFISNGEGESWAEAAAESVQSDTVSKTEAICCGNNRFWAKAEYLHWHTRGMDLPTLLTNGDTVLVGDQPFNDDWQSGGRLLVGFWLDHCQDFGLDFVYTAIQDQTESFAGDSIQFPDLTRPFFNISTGLQDSRLIGSLGVVAGDVAVEATTEYQVFEILIRRTVSNDYQTPTYLVYGYRYAELNDLVSIDDFSTSNIAELESFDDFRTENTFHGFEAGLITDWRLSPFWQINLAGKVAFGETSTTTSINGQTTALPGGVPVSGGLLTQASNIGTFESNSHGVLQDFSVSLRRDLQCGITFNVGYGIHRWIDVERAGEQIDTSLNPTQIGGGVLVGEARPEVLHAKSDFIAQGLTLGLEYYW